MFNKKEIEKLKLALDDSVNKSNQDISDLRNQVNQVKESLDKVLNTLDSKTFSKDWEEYQKWKELKDKLPDIEMMYQLKELKYSITRKDKLLSEYDKARLGLLRIEQDPYRQDAINSQKEYCHNLLEAYGYRKKEIDNILKFIKSKSNQKDLIEVFKLYGISLKWLQS